MSLVSQLNNKKSNVMSFFVEYQDDAGMDDILKKLQSTIPAKKLTFKPESPLVTSSYIGFMSDLLFRMIIGGESFDYRQTIVFDEHFLLIGRTGFEEYSTIKLLKQICSEALADKYFEDIIIKSSKNFQQELSSDKALESRYFDYIF